MKKFLLFFLTFTLLQSLYAINNTSKGDIAQKPLINNLATQQPIEDDYIRTWVEKMKNEKITLQDGQVILLKNHAHWKTILYGIISAACLAASYLCFRQRDHGEPFFQNTDIAGSLFLVGGIVVSGFTIKRLLDFWNDNEAYFRLTREGIYCNEEQFVKWSNVKNIEVTKLFIETRDAETGAYMGEEYVGKEVSFYNVYGDLIFDMHPNDYDEYLPISIERFIKLVERYWQISMEQERQKQ